MSKFSISEENYIKSVYLLEKEGEKVSTNQLANFLHTTPASTTDMIKKLQQKQLLAYEKYRGVGLTVEGKKMAINIVRKHRLWEYFLVEKLQLSWNEVHEIAEQLEHIVSDKLIDHLDVFLNHPQFDPHGDPIPSKTGEFAQRKSICLTDIAINEPVEISSVQSQNRDFLELLTQKNLTIGSKIKIFKKYSYDQSLDIINHQANDAVQTLSYQLAQQIQVIKIA